jgi:hypothetical protein
MPDARPVRAEARGMSALALLSARDQALVEAVARRVVELLDERSVQQPNELVDATTLARLLSISRSTVYDNAERLGAIELGDGARPRLRFDVETARNAWSRRVSSEGSQALETAVVAEVRRRRRGPRTGSGADLLPVGPRRTPTTGGQAA